MLNLFKRNVYLDNNATTYVVSERKHYFFKQGIKKDEVLLCLN
jgi:hypothetical protein